MQLYLEIGLIGIRNKTDNNKVIFNLLPVPSKLEYKAPDFFLWRLSNEENDLYIVHSIFILNEHIQLSLYSE